MADAPDSISVTQFILGEEYGRFPVKKSRPPQICGVTGFSYSASQVRDRVEHLARAMARDLGCSSREGKDEERVVAIFSLNSIDYQTLSWAVHRMDGVVTPANALYSVSELTYQLKHSGAKCPFASAPQLETALQAASKPGISRKRVYLLELPVEITGKVAVPSDIKTLNQLIQDGSAMVELEPQNWSKGQGKRQVAYLCYSSGTSGLPKGVMISHYNIIFNTLQLDAVEKLLRQGQSLHQTETILGLLPQICHAAAYRGDAVITFPRYSLQQLLSSVQRWKINVLVLVPPIIIEMCNNSSLLAKYDLRSVTRLVTGGAPLREENAKALSQDQPAWKISITETTGVVSYTGADDIWNGSCGPLLPYTEARLVTPEGLDVSSHDRLGELWLRSPSIAMGYKNNPAETSKTFGDDGWMRTGDEAIVKRSP
ncbi:uncharacterized protein Z520_03948 [Fonsecaea multimorphosa CBS 102226]|uniref:AMP-dependent synthetase/ligase domain-containing protein n=1 Tax=Fonsecaea multimorphosa CBS 102226 TaxID=1442371 RepID=A0A0D2K354_9EURO|nr:uncharacterized protein Z520_03948 [Fonsecaea multimorphosa CBS 102226]KIY00263.1 hypothetical protein Z520_03948 [Fonsecaea multimorphosa CBS 102226]